MVFFKQQWETAQHWKFSWETLNIVLGRLLQSFIFFCSPHLLNYQFAKNFRIKKLCRLLAHIDQRSPWAFIFIIIAFYFLWFWQNESLGSIFKPGLSENEWNGWSVWKCWHPRWWGQDWGQDTSRVRTCPHPASDAGVSPMDSGELWPSCRQSLPGRRPDSDTRAARYIQRSVKLEAVQCWSDTECGTWSGTLSSRLERWRLLWHWRGVRDDHAAGCVISVPDCCWVRVLCGQHPGHPGGEHKDPGSGPPRGSQGQTCGHQRPGQTREGRRYHRRQLLREHRDPQQIIYRLLFLLIITLK